MHPAFISDALDDFRGVDPWTAPAVVAPTPNESRYHPAIRPIVANMRRLRGVGAPSQVGPQGLDLGFLLACNAAAPDIFGDLAAWRLGTRNAMRSDLHATGVI